jgi:hypothetical protein
LKYKTLKLDKMKLENENLDNPQNPQLNIGVVSFSIFDKVYMDSPFGRYTGEVKSVEGGKMTIESHSPTGRGSMWADYEIDGTEWQKY